MPPVCPTSIESPCSIIDISYELEFKYSVSGLHKGKRISFPVVIGTKPLLDRSSSRASQFEIPRSPTSYTFQASVFGPSSNDSPPCYGDVIASEVYESNMKYFTPFYPFYTLQTSSV